MKTHYLFCTAGLAAIVAACGPIRIPGQQSEPAPAAELEAELPPAEPVSEPEPTPEPDTSITIQRAEIDWDTARADMAAQPAPPEGTAVSVASGPSATPVPILLPSSPVVTASSGDGETMSFRPLNDGYYAVYPGPDYDMIINGTDKLAAAPGRTGSAGDSPLRFEETMTGAQVAFSRYGASYLIEFACKSETTIAGDNCVSEDEALAAVEDLLIAGTQ